MMSPSSYYLGLKGKPLEELKTELEGLRREISELKKSLQTPDFTQPDMFPDRETRLSMALDYFDMAKKALTEAGGDFVPTADEKRAEDFDKRLNSISEIRLTIGSFFDFPKTFIAEISGPTASFFLTSLDYDRRHGFDMPADEFINRLKELRLGHWQPEYLCRGVADGEEWSAELSFEAGDPAYFRGLNAYPFSFHRFCDLMGREEYED